MKRFLFLTVLALVMVFAFALPTSVFADGNVTVNMTYIGPNGTVEGDFAGFKVLRDGELIQTITTPIPNAQYIDANLPDPPEEGYVYTVTAFDTENSPGNPSGTATAKWETFPGPLQGTVNVTVGVNINLTITPPPE